MKPYVNNSCGKKGCDSRDLTLPNDGKLIHVRSGVYEAWDDLEEVLPLPGLSLGKKLEKRRQMEKMAA